MRSRLAAIHCCTCSCTQDGVGGWQVATGWCWEWLSSRCNDAAEGWAGAARAIGHVSSSVRMPGYPVDASASLLLRSRLNGVGCYSHACTRGVSRGHVRQWAIWGSRRLMSDCSVCVDRESTCVCVCMWEGGGCCCSIESAAAACQQLPERGLPSLYRFSCCNSCGRTDSTLNDTVGMYYPTSNSASKQQGTAYVCLTCFCKNFSASSVSG